MKTNLVCGLLLLGMLTVSLNSCRTDEMLTSTEQTQKEKIAFFERFEKEKSLSKNAASNNYALPFGNSMLAYFEKYPEKKTELENKYGTVDLRVSSQDIGGDEGDNRKLLFFPMLKDGKVTAVIAGVINAERDYLYFDVHQSTHSDVIYLINTFQDYYETKIVSRNSNNPIDVGEVIIRVTRPVRLTMYDGWGGNGGPGNGGHDMGGGPGDYGGGGSGSNPNTPNNTNPCEQTKNKLQDPNIKKVIEEVKDQAEKAANDINEGETGKIEKNDGTILPADVSADHHVTFNDITNSKGAYHSHTMTGAKIHSPPDIMLLLDLAAVQPSASDYGNAYLGMIGATKCSCPGGFKYYHYIIRFSGTASDLTKNFTDGDMKEFIKGYREKESKLAENLNYVDFLGDNLNKTGLEKLFFDTLEKMGLSEKVILQRIDDNGKVMKIILDSNKVPTETPC
ncbi:hypothetical protein [Chryseobacterium sp. SIMBA_028]|uniref:hypothetical protein n=2 Tax=Chryseobacterium sp. SIMBA_028 TaxID=3085771 RepID=UPI00397D4F54